jgi:glutamine synthetase
VINDRSGRVVETKNLGFKPRYKEGYFPVGPTDSQQDIRAEMVREMENVGIRVEKHHHEVATAGQAEIDMRFLPLTKMGDSLMWYKYIVKNVARRHGKTATFMPKPLFGDNGSGMHVHQSIWSGEKPLFAGDKYGGMSEMALHYIAGILKHAPALAALTNPTCNSYHRLVPGFEAPVNLAYSSRNRSAAVRIPMYSPSPKAKRIEVRFPDPCANGYIAFAAMLMAGPRRHRAPAHAGQPARQGHLLAHARGAEGRPVHAGLARRRRLESEEGPRVPAQGRRLHRGPDRDWIEWKTGEIDALRLRPHPYEFHLYYDA